MGTKPTHNTGRPINMSGLKMWPKGFAPNPKGRKPGSGAKCFSDAAKAVLAEVDPKLKKSGADRLVEQSFRRALQGSYKHLELLLAYAEGKPSLSIDMSARVLHAHTVYRDPKLAQLTEDELKQLDLLSRKLLAPEAQTDDAKTLEVTAEVEEEL